MNDAVPSFEAFEAVFVTNARGQAPVVLVCEHASNVIPTQFAGLGLTPETAVSHAAFDIGALDVARRLSQRLDAPLVEGRVSRLVYDCNRPPDAHDAIPARSEIHGIPGNVALNEASRTQRVSQVYQPFHDTLAAVLAGHPDPCVLVTMHSFTPVYNGRKRDVELGLLHSADDRLARAMLAHSPKTGWRSALNAPYGPLDGVLHTLDLHAPPRRMLNVMIELRNDLISDPEGVVQAGDLLAALLQAALGDLGLGPEVMA